MMKKSTRKIVHVVARFPPALGGMEQVVLHLARNQYKLGHSVKVLTSDEKWCGPHQEDEPFQVSRLKSFNLAHTTIILDLLPQLLSLEQDSMIHLHISCAYIPEMVSIYSRLRGVRYLAHLHLDVLPSGRAGPLLDPYKKTLLRRVLRDAAAVIVPTDDYRELISEKYRIPKARVVVIGNGTNHRIADQPKSLQGDAVQRRLLFVGRLSVQKNIPLMLDAIAVYLREYGNEVRLSIAGEGEKLLAVLSQIDRLGLGDVVKLHGRVDGEALESLYELSDVFLLTSMNESFGLVFIEAMTKGLPIVSVNIPAVRNVVANGVNGLLVDSTPEAVAGALHTLLADKALYSAISKNNLAKSLDYDWKNIAEQFVMLYDSVLR